MMDEGSDEAPIGGAEGQGLFVAVPMPPAEPEDKDGDDEDDVMEEPRLELVGGGGTDALDNHSATFTIRDEDHTLGNALRYALVRNSSVAFAGYTVPHPLEKKVNIRVQTRKGLTAVDALDKAAQDLKDTCGAVLEAFDAALVEYEAR